MKVNAYIICKEHGKQKVVIEKNTHMELRDMFSTQMDSINRHTAKCPKCGVRCLCIEE